MTNSVLAAGRELSAPVWPVAATAASAAIAVALAIFSLVNAAQLPEGLAALGYGLGAVVTTVTASLYRGLRNSRRTHPRFRVRRGRDRLVVLAMAIGLTAGLVNAVLLATEWAK